MVDIDKLMNSQILIADKERIINDVMVDKTKSTKN